MTLAEPNESDGGRSETRPIAVVTVTHNAEAVLPGFLASLSEATSQAKPPIIAVDNGSSDGTRSLLREQEGLILVEQANTGYAHGVNRGMERAPSGHDIMVLNPDTVLGTGLLDRLVAVLEDDPRAGVVVPTLRAPTGEVLPSLHYEPRAWRTLVEAVVGGTRSRRFGEAYRPDPRAGRQTADWATGAAMLLRSEVLDRLGGFDESYFLYSEETELCLRVGDAGYRVVHEPAAIVEHVGGPMAQNPLLWALRAVNRVRLAARRSSSRSTRCLHLASIAFELRRVVTGDGVSRAALRALLHRDLDAVAVEIARKLGADVSPMLAATGDPPVVLRGRVHRTDDGRLSS